MAALSPYFDWVKLPDSSLPALEEAMAEHGTLGLTSAQGSYLLIPTLCG